ncbi:MAG: CotH kinase family protein, partial [Verrucomicrobiales bacterium]
MRNIILIPTLISLLLLKAALGQSPNITVAKDQNSDAYLIQLNGVDENEVENWKLKSSVDLVTWDDADISSVESGGWIFTPDTDAPSLYFRAIYEIEVSDPGLYDLSSYRVMELDFDDANWATQLTTNYGSEVNVSANLTLDGELHEGVGVRYKGDTSYRLATTAKKSFGIYVDDTDEDLTLMDYKTLNLNNSFSDASFMREVLYNNFCRQYMPSPQTNFVHLFVNGVDYGVYINAQQENGDFLNEVFVDNDGDRWRAGLAPNTTGGGGPGGGGPGGGGPGGGGPGGGGDTFLNFGGDLSWLGATTTLYEDGYILKSDKNPDPWTSLVTTIDVLNNTNLADLPNQLEDVMAVDSFLWMLALESLFIDGDGYLAKAGDYLLYHDINTGRIHPIQHDGNETFNSEDTEIPDGVTADPFYGEDLDEERPLTARLFAIDSYRQRYLAHLRTILNESYHWDYFEPRIAAYKTMIEADVLADTLKQTSNSEFQNEVSSEDGELRSFIEARRTFLLSHDEINQESPSILFVDLADSITPVATVPTIIQAEIGDGSGVSAVTLYYTTVEDGAYTKVAMVLAASDYYEAQIPGELAGTVVYYYIEAQADDSAGTRAYFPARAESAPLSYQIEVKEADSTQIIINELMADNEATIADSAGEFDDWIELRNLSDVEVDLSGMYLSDNGENPRKWDFPEGTTIAANGYLIVWADEDGDEDQEGLHANFKLSSKGETVTLVDTDVNNNLLLDTWTYGDLAEDTSISRTSDGLQTSSLTPSPGQANQPPFSPIRSGPKAASKPSRQKQIPS